MDVLTLRDGGPAGAVWPSVALDVDAELRSGWRPLPFRQFILKVHSRCNLACDYCYVYRSADQRWRSQPARMSRAVVTRTAERIAQHVRVHGLSHVEVVLHGGEPLLAGPQFLAFVCTALRAAVPDGVRVDLSVQTNATLLDEAVLNVFCQHDVRVGVSLDGGPLSHDVNRHRAGGRGSHSAVVRGLWLLRSPRYHRLFAGILCVVDLRGDPVAVYEHLIAHQPPVVDFLLPHANWSSPPYQAPGHPVAPYGDWLVAAFDRWYSASQREASVRLFDDIIRGVLGQPSRVETVGLTPARSIVVEANGSIEQIDTLKSAYDGATYTGLHVNRDAFDAAVLQPHTVARQLGVAALSEQCQRCHIRDVCGGGYYPHRYHRATGFRNPSVYCRDLTVLIRHIHSRVRADLTRGARGRQQLQVPA
jgi:uncharacterized protein